MTAYPDIKLSSPAQLKTSLLDNNFPAFHAGQILSWIYKRGVLDFEKMSDLPANLRSFLKTRFNITCASIKDKFVSKDGTVKFALRLPDEAIIETVYIPAQGRGTLCLSSQVGCKFSCVFCASSYCIGSRNLSYTEILEQILLAKAQLPQRQISHIVFMGIGEPLDNLGAVSEAIKIINAPWAFNIGKRRITISTCGLIPQIDELAHSNLGVELSVSLHAADDAARSKIMSINKKYPLRDLLSALSRYQQKTGRQITFEYLLIHDFNTGQQAAEKLKILLSQLDCKLNLLTFNPVKESALLPASKEEIGVFKNSLTRLGLRATLRKPRGADIQAACGQLRANLESK